MYKMRKNTRERGKHTMSLPIKTALKQYYHPAECPICKHPIKGHARAQCSNCHRIVCQSHMVPYLGPNKMCPDCLAKQKQFLQPTPQQPAMPVQPNPTPAAAAPETTPFGAPNRVGNSVDPVLQKIANAEELYNTDKVAEARSITNSVFIDIFGVKK